MMHFWRVLAWTCLRKPQSIQTFLGLAILGYHFRRVYEDMLSSGSAASPGAPAERATPVEPGSLALPTAAGALRDGRPS